MRSRWRRAAAGFVLAILPLATVSAFAQSDLSIPFGADAANAPAPAAAPEPWQVGTLPLGGPVDAREYVVGPGDVFRLNLSGRVTRDLPLQVGAEGAIYVPGVGPIAIAGRTLEESRREVTRRLTQVMRGVSVDLRLIRTRVMKVYLAGEVRVSGALAVPATAHASDALPDSGFTPGASERNIYLRRRTAGRADEQVVPVDLERFRLLGLRTGDPLLRDGDVIVVPPRLMQVTIEGAVPRPGSYELGPGDSLRTIVDLAGGLLPSVAERALLVQFTSPERAESTSFEVADLASGGFNPALGNGDRIYFYFLPRFHQLDQVEIYGEISRPGSYPIRPGVTRITDLVRTAGGFLDRADLSTIRVYRGSRIASDADPELARLGSLSRREMTTTEYETLRARLAARAPDLRVDWSRVQQSEDLDIRLQSGDVIRVDAVSASVRVDGEVKRPGIVAFADGRTVAEYIALAGGFSKMASRGHVRLTSMANGQTVLARDAQVVAPGDLIYVPDRGESSLWQNSQTIILVLAQVATIILALRR